MLSTNKFQNSRQDRDNYSIYVIILAAGLGQRFDSVHLKQFYPVKGRTPVERCVELFLGLDYVDGVVCVVPTEYADRCCGVADPRVLAPVIGGETRQDSVRCGLKALIGCTPDFVLVHDSARCFCDAEVVNNVTSALLEGSSAVVPVAPCVDSVRFQGKGIDRSDVKLVQTPQGFDYRLLARLHDKYRGKALSDDASLFDLEGLEVTLVDGNIKNRKLTYKSDVGDSIIKTGFGYDAHRFSSDPSRKLYLMGAEIPNSKGLEGVSDADVGIHSLVDAILGALGKGSIGEHFPAKDPKNHNADSKIFLKYCKKLLDKSNASILNIDATIVCESPSISSFSRDMKESVATCLEISEELINIKGKTTEGMGFEGRKEGISAYSIVSIKLN